MKNLNTKKADFSLVELTIVVVILGVLATFAVPRFMTSVERTKAAEAFNYLSQVETAQARYNAEHGRYTVVFAQDGFNSRKSSIPDTLSP